MDSLFVASKDVWEGMAYSSEGEYLMLDRMVLTMEIILAKANRERAANSNQSLENAQYQMNDVTHPRSSHLRYHAVPLLPNLSL